MNSVFYVLIVWNIIVFCIYGLDKRRAKKNEYRISERTLLLLAFFFGAVGAALGMSFFRHKTKHMKFQILVPLFVIINCICFLYMKDYL